MKDGFVVVRMTPIRRSAALGSPIERFVAVPDRAMGSFPTRVAAKRAFVRKHAPELKLCGINEVALRMHFEWLAEEMGARIHREESAACAIAA